MNESFFAEVGQLHFQRIEDLRVDNDCTQKKIAEYLNMRPGVYRRYEKGEREIPTWAAIKLARLYNCSIDYLLGETNRPERYK